MGFFKYPYTDLNELNLDWVIARIKELTEYVATITNADQISYDNTGTVLSADNVQAAITELQTIITTASVVSFNGRTGAVVPVAGDYDADIVNYDNSNSGLSATETQSAIDELAARPLGGVESFNSRTGAVVPTAGDYSGSDVTYDNTGSGLVATDVQNAIDEVNNKIPATIVESFNTRTGAVLPVAGDYEAEDITYDNTTSGLTATDTQAAIDELDNRLDNFSVAASQVSYDNTVSGLTATDAQAAIDEIANDVLSSGVASFNGRTGAVNPAAGDYDGSDIDYDNTTSGLTATDVQAAIDEIDGTVDDLVADQGRQIATVEGATASRAYGIGEWIIDEAGYTGIVIAAVSSGAAWTLDTNYKRQTLGEHASEGIRIALISHGAGITAGMQVKSIYDVLMNIAAARRYKAIVKYGNAVFRIQQFSSSSLVLTRSIVTGTEITVIALVSDSSAGHYYEYTISAGGTTITDNSNITLGGDFGVFL